MNKISYKLYPTLLDSFTNYLKSEVYYDKYYAWSDNPEYTPEKYQKKCFDELIDRINRVPFDSEAADKGTAFNEVIDCMIENRKSEIVQVERLLSDMMDGRQALVGLRATYNNRQFDFPISICREFANYYKGALSQQRVEAILHTCFGDVLVYGVIDELMPMSVHDIKTTGSYYVGKFKDHWQHIVYPYCLMQNGSDVRLFEYNITDFKNTYTETYTFVPERDIPILVNHCEEFIRFLNDNRDLITDKKIFAEDA